MKAVLIIAGGSGERFWPLSTQDKPKQLLKIFTNKPLIRETVERILPLVPRERIFICTNIKLGEKIRAEVLDIPEENIILEPVGRDTASAIAYGALVIQEKFHKEKIELIVLPSDHLIKKEEEFRQVLEIACQEARHSGVIVTLGIKPTRAETAYGYIEVKDSNISLNEIYRVRRFREKPNLEVAEKYLNSGNYLWNSGIFIFSIETIFKNFQVLMEEHWEILERIKKKLRENPREYKNIPKIIEEDFMEFEKISIDFGIMEYSKNIRVIPVDIQWSDLGSYNAFEEIFSSDENGNITRENAVFYESSNNIVVGENIHLLGVQGLVVVRGEEGNILVAKRDRIQDIKKLLEFKKNML
ncbi:MAG: mannose-1-phosphate guanylyltransferase [Cetobacterium sp.]